jgi:hypothetical protein
VQRCGASFSAALLALFLGACGGASSATAAGANSAASAAATLPALPDDPLLLVPNGARMLARVNVEQAKASDHYVDVRHWILRYTCIDRKTSPWLAERTQRVVLAEIALGGAGEPQWLGITRGDYLAEDAQQAARQVFAARGAPLPAAQVRGRFTIWQGAETSVARLSEHLLAAGHTDELLAALEVADGKRPNWIGRDVLMQGLDAERWLDDHTLAAIAQLDEKSAHRLGRELQGVGADQYANQLAQGSVAVAVVLTRDIGVQVQGLYPNANQAAQNAEEIRSMLGQAGFVLRLLGWPAGLADAQVNAEGPLLKLGLQLSHDDVQQLKEKLQSRLEQNEPKCPPPGG